MEKTEEKRRITELLQEITAVYQRVLGDKLRGLYFHGSLAFGCFRWESSDIDFLAVVQGELTHGEKRQLLDWILSVREKCPPKGLEMSIVEEHCCRAAGYGAFVHPTPFLFHWSEGHLEKALADPDGYCETMQGTDRDLAAHFMVTNLVGWAFLGPEVREMFPPVPKEAYWDSLVYDVEHMEEDIAAHPVYCVLNLCRVLAWCRSKDGDVYSKAEGGRWGLEHLEEKWHGIIRNALAAYENGTDAVWDMEALRAFAAESIREIKNWKKEPEIMKSQAFHGEVWINAHEEILEAVVKVNSEPITGGYGNDDHTARATALMQQYFDRRITTTCTINGTAANVMAMKDLLGRLDAVLCAEQTHMHTYEAGAFEFCLGNKIITAKTPDGKLTPQIIRDTLTAHQKYHYNPKVIVMAQPTEYGTVYTADEIREICTLAHERGMLVYVDGARIGNAAAALGIGLREMLDETGVDAFSFGGTKAGALFGEMVVFLHPFQGINLGYSQKQSLQHMAKSKFLGVQLEVILEKQFWLRDGEASNAMARYMESRLRELGYEIYYPVESNMVFCVIPPEKFAPLCAVYDMHYWDEFTHVVRLATTYRTTKEEVDALAERLGRAD